MTDRGEIPASDLTRRRFLGRGVAVAGGVTLLSGAGANASTLARAAAKAAAYKPVALTNAEMATLKSVLDALFPADSVGPGALEIGVPVYIDRALVGSYKPLLPVYQGLLPLFDKAAASMGAASFSALSAAQQTTLLGQFEAGKAPGVSAAAASAAAGSFQLLLEHMREGLFADPMYGGNRNRAGWKLIGYPDIKITWTASQQKVGAHVNPSGKTAKSYGGKPYNGPGS
jgi:hypothetical protein